MRMLNGEHQSSPEQPVQSVAAVHAHYALQVPEKEPAHLLRDTAVSRIGAEIYLQHKRMLAAFERGELPSLRQLYVYHNHFTLLEHEFGCGQERHPENSIEVSLQELALITTRLVKRFENVQLDPGSLPVETEIYFESARAIYRKLNAETVLSHIPGAGEIGLELIEFDTDFSGYCHEILPAIEKLEEQLLIDTERKTPQEGFGCVLTVSQLLDILHLRQSRIFVSMLDGEVCGFYLPIFNPASVREYSGAHYDELVKEGILDADTSAGWVHITGTAKSNRSMMARAGIHLYGVFDQMVTSNAQREGLSVLIGAVREGKIANTSVNAHIRAGWKLTDHVFTGADGITPYRTIIRSIPLNEKQERAHQQIGIGSHVEVYYDSPPMRDRGIETARERITYDEAAERCQTYFSGCYGFSLRSMDGYYGHYIMMQSRNMIRSLQQVRPGIDRWQYLQGGDNENLGPLSALLPLVARDMGVIPARR